MYSLKRKHIVTALVLGGYLATIFGANWAIQRFGVVSVGFGFAAPAGVYFVGLAFTLRDIAQERSGVWGVTGAILCGALLSAFVSPQLAVASGAAFLFSEGADFLVYTPLRTRSFWVAVVLSNLVGLVLDSVLFLWLAFGNFTFLEGQIIGKTEMTILAVLVLFVFRRLRI